MNRHCCLFTFLASSAYATFPPRRYYRHHQLHFMVRVTIVFGLIVFHDRRWIGLNFAVFHMTIAQSATILIVVALKVGVVN